MTKILLASDVVKDISLKQVARILPYLMHASKSRRKF